MKRLLFLLLLVSQIAYGQEVTTYGGKALTYGGDVATYAYCDEYQAVYDAYTVKPSDATAAVWNTFVTKCVATGEWAALDVLWNYAGVSDNTNGEALINWKQPAGGASLMDTGKGTFDSGTESWVKYENNTIENDAGALKITYVNNTSGAYCTFSAVSDLSTNLTSGKTYRIRVKAKVNVGSNVLLQHYNTVDIVSFGTVNTTDFTWYSGIFVAKSPNACVVKMSAMGAGEIIWIDEWTIQEWTNATAYNAPTFTALEGFTGNGTTQYIDCNWNPSVNGVNYVQNSASMIIYVRTNIAADGQHGIGNAADFKNIFILPKYTIDNSYIRTNDATTISGANSDGSGMFINTRTASTVNKLYKNKVAIINATSVSTGMPTHLAYCLAINDDDVATGFRADQVSMYAFGGGMTQTQVTNLTTYYEAAMDALGKGVIP